MKINVEFSNLSDMVNFADFVVLQAEARANVTRLKEYEKMLANAQEQLERAYAKLNSQPLPEVPEVEFNTLDNQEGSIDIWFTNRTFNCLTAERITNLRQLVNCTANDLLKTPNFGRKCLKEVRDELAKYNLKLKGE